MGINNFGEQSQEGIYAKNNFLNYAYYAKTPSEYFQPAILKSCKMY